MPHTSLNIVMVINKKGRMIRAELVSRMWEKRNAHRTSAGKPEWKIPLERPNRKWEDNIKIL